MKHFNLISEKLKEADFFLEKMVSSDRRIDELNYYFSAFASAARSVTFVLQYVGKRVDAYDDWYSEIQVRLKEDKISRYLVAARNESQKKGIQPITAGQVVKLPSGEERLLHFFSYVGLEPLPDVPDSDALSVCRYQMKNLVAIVSEFFTRFEGLIFSPPEERANLIEQLRQVKSEVNAVASPEALWEQLTAFILHVDFQPRRPSETIKHLVAKYE